MLYHVPHKRKYIYIFKIVRIFPTHFIAYTHNFKSLNGGFIGDSLETISCKDFFLGYHLVETQTRLFS